ncbi:hypothetical protein FBEOM_5406 [Fusarium beomiforme]|uniref:Uncharacterized protein n=1 Tax=Fusarium beomiforme TaxID=44412 RepID=A0A9P5DZ21_9HYPO|nr:hypothetical protein FBEOM_5406 [Fusarium beomiforme]
MVITRSQKRKADEAELQSQGSVPSTRRIKINFYMQGKLIKTAHFNDDQVAMPTPRATPQPEDKTLKVVPQTNSNLTTANHSKTEPNQPRNLESGGSETELSGSEGSDFGESEKKMGKLILAHKASNNQSMYPIVKAYRIVGHRVEKPAKNHIELRLNPCKESQRVEEQVLRRLLRSQTAANKTAN